MAPHIQPATGKYKRLPFTFAQHYKWLAILIPTIAITILFLTSSYSSKSEHSFRGPQYWKQGVTQSFQTLYETPYARFQLHQVQLGSNLIKDWLWYDESDNINVLVQHQDGTFLVLQQTKYAIPGNTLAVLGGLIEPGETPLQAAQRELREELGLQASDWTSLGEFVAAANRGGGTTHVFWAKNARSLESQKHVTQGELERQEVVRLSKKEILEALLLGRFREIKWTATVALALLQI